MTEAEFSQISMAIGLTLGIGYMLFIMYKLAVDSNAGKYGMFIIFLALGLGIFGFVAKYFIKLIITAEVGG